MTRLVIEEPVIDGGAVVLTTSHFGRNQNGIWATVGAWNGHHGHRARINLDNPDARKQYGEVAHAEIPEASAEQFARVLRDMAAKIEQHINGESDAGDAGDADSAEESAPAETQAAILVRLATDAGWSPFHDPDGMPYVTLPGAQGEAQTHKLNNKEVRLALMRLYHTTKGQVPRTQAIQDALGILQGRAIFDGPACAVYVRLASHEDTIYLDLCDEAWQVIKVTADGWSVIRGDAAPVKFRRARGMLPLPLPRRGACIDDLRPFLNAGTADTAPDDTRWRLLVGWLIGTFNPHGPYPALDIQGEQGSAKTTTARILRSLIDPHSVPLRSEPREVRDLMIAASNSWIVAFDNLSDIREWLSDSLCRVSTGGGFGVREHYANDEETLFDVTRPALLTGIGQVATKPDLLDRLIIVEQPSIPEDQRTDERSFWAHFEEKRAGILGALLDAVVMAQRNKDSVHLARKPRMADFALWVTAAESAFGWQPSTFVDAYSANRSSANDMALDASPVGVAVCAFMDGRDEWTGTATDLLKELTEKVGEATSKGRDWPKKGHVLTNDLKMLAPSLRAASVAVSWERSGKRRSIHLLRGKGGENGVTGVTTGEQASHGASPASHGASPSDHEASFVGRERHLFHASSDAGDAGDAPEQHFSPDDDEGDLVDDWIAPDPPLAWMHRALGAAPPTAPCQQCGAVMWEAVTTESGSWWRCMYLIKNLGAGYTEATE